MIQLSKQKGETMCNEIYQQRVTLHEGTSLIATVVPQTARHGCDGCYFEQKGCVDLRLGNPTFECSSFDRDDNKSIIWIKLEEEQPVSKPRTIKEIRAKTLTLQKEIYNLIKTFESDTDMVVHSVNLLHDQLVSARTRTTFGVELDVRLN